MALAPFMFIGHPDKNPLKVLKESSVCMKGKKLEFIRLILSFGSGYASRGYYTIRDTVRRNVGGGIRAEKFLYRHIRKGR